MACRGVFFALDDDQTNRILTAVDDAQLRDIVLEIEELWDERYLAQCDKSWDAMHRLLSDGTLDWNGGEYPLNQVVLGQLSLHQGGSYIICFKDAGCVHDIARAIRDFDRSQLESWYYSKVPKDYAIDIYGAEDFEYTWENFDDVRRFYANAAAEDRSVVFTVDQ